jgi:hypothetical protein
MDSVVIQQVSDGLGGLSGSVQLKDPANDSGFLRAHHSSLAYDQGLSIGVQALGSTSRLSWMGWRKD